MKKIDEEILLLEKHVRTLLLLEEERMEERCDLGRLPRMLQDAADMMALIMQETGVRFGEEEEVLSALNFLADPDTGCREDLCVSVFRHRVTGVFITRATGFSEDRLCGVLDGIKERMGGQAWFDTLERNLLRNTRDWLLDRLADSEGVSEKEAGETD